KPSHAVGQAVAGGSVPGTGRIPAVLASLVVVTLLGAVDLVLAPQVVVLGLLVVGPALAAVSARARSVLVVGGYSLVLAVLLSIPDELWAKLRLCLYLAAIAGVMV